LRLTLRRKVISGGDPRAVLAQLAKFIPHLFAQARCASTSSFSWACIFSEWPLRWSAVAPLSWFTKAWRSRSTCRASHELVDQLLDIRRLRRAHRFGDIGWFRGGVVKEWSAAAHKPHSPRDGNEERLF